MLGYNRPLALTRPALRSDLPVYPPLLQLLRVTDGTVPGPSGYASSSAIGPDLYIAFTQQLRTDTLLPRDREPCLALDVNSAGLTAGYYLGRLAGTYTSLPIYEVVDTASGTHVATIGDGSSTTITVTHNLGTRNVVVQIWETDSDYEKVDATVRAPTANTVTVTFATAPTTNQYTVVVIKSGGSVATTVLLPGLSTAQYEKVVNNLTQTQINVLNNLTPCQLQTFVQLEVTDMQRLTTNLTPPQLTRVVDDLTFTQLSQTVTTTSTAQTLIVSSAYPALYQLIYHALTPSQAISLLTNLTAHQISTLIDLSANQISTVGQLTTAQQQLLTSLTASQVTTLIGQLTLSQITDLLDTLTAAQLRLLTNSLTANQIQQAMLSITASQLGNLIPITTWPGVGAQATFPQIPSIVGRPSSTPSPALPGYGSVVLDQQDGKLYGYTPSGWQDLSSASAGSTEGTLAAAGSTQGDAAAITDDATEVTGADGTKGVRLPDEPGIYTVWNNDGSNSLNVYPPSGAQLSNLGTDIPQILGITQICLYARITSTQWGFVLIGTG